MTRLALFDLDDTLTDLSGAFSRWAAEFSARYRLAEDAAAWLVSARSGGPLDRFFAEVRQRFDLAEPGERLGASYRARIPQLVQLYPGVLDDLGTLRAAGWRIGIVTNGMRDNQLAKIHRTGLANAIDGYCISAAAGLRKPDPRLFRLAARNRGTTLAPGDWVIGDSPGLDIAGGHNARLRTLWISHGRPWPQGQPPHRLATSLREAVQILSEEPAPRATAIRPPRPDAAPSGTD
ncbi:HAD family hydrolase [Amycolatopsis rubida]|uniref:HAD family hydrolase n=1 Tax=Amycolatopsis rubida TaxID=112413 RepID=A0ABX0C702_9PSEU|nr:HAD family hydrolase [Amycolatopsis sp. M39]MYW97487.1 HAD hydrolase-like protein [Amycolatopsis rubida]NEC62472.1 HAD family hydrolase [Amycolatopsis rubida]OAP22259.1 Pyrimidine 5'-nucleotidase YjjG [Amycolatopsis sp. M39]